VTTPDLTCPTCGEPKLVRFAYEGREYPLSKCRGCLMVARWDTFGGASGWRRSVPADWKIGYRPAAKLCFWMWDTSLAAKLAVGEEIKKEG
jgi:hypothetical protein